MNRETKIKMYELWMDGSCSMVQLSRAFYVSIEYVSDAIIEGSMMCDSLSHYEGEK